MSEMIDLLFAVFAMLLAVVYLTIMFGAAWCVVSVLTRLWQIWRA